MKRQPNKRPTPGNRTACKKATPPPLTQEILFARKLKKVAARQKTLPAKSDKQLSQSLLKSRFDYEERMFCLTETLQKAAAAVQEMGSIYAILRERRRTNGGEDSAPWFLAEEKAHLLEVAAKFPSAAMLGNLSLAELCDVAGILPDTAATDNCPSGREANDSTTK